MNGKEILKNCERFFLESSSHSMETVIELSDAEEAINDFLNNIINNENKSIIDDTFKEIDKKFKSILNDSTINWIKTIIMSHITEAYNRGKQDLIKNNKK